MGCKSSKATQVETPTRPDSDSKAEVQTSTETTPGEKEGEVVVPGEHEESMPPLPQMDDAAAPGTCTFCCA